MDLVTAGLLLTVFIVSAWFIKLRRNLPPGPWPLPLFGNLSLVGKFSRKRSHFVLYETAKKYGNVMSFKIGNQLAVVLTGYDVIYEALVKQADVFSSRPTHLPFYKELTRDGNGIAMNAYSSEWKYLRSFTSQCLLGSGIGKSSVEEKILMETEEVAKCLATNPGEPVSIYLLVQKLTTNVITGIAFGVRYNFDDPKFSEIVEMIDKYFRSSGSLEISNFLPNLLAKIMEWKNTKSRQQRQENIKQMSQYISQHVDEHAHSYDPGHIRDLVDLYIRAINEGDNEDKHYLTRGNILRTIGDLFLAGSETTTKSFAWVFLYMALYPEVQETCQGEIRRVFGDKTVHWTDRKQLPYVMATIMEIQRASIVVPLGISHCTTRDTTLGGYTIPHGTMVLPSLYSAAMDTKYWNEPEVFNPGRFIGESGEVLNNAAFVPFSIGPRACLGEALARMELFLVFTNLMQRFRFRCESDTVRPSLEPRLSSLLNSPECYKLRVYKRTTNC